MGSPLLNLSIFLVLAVAVAMLFWPEHGLLSRLAQQRRMSGRTRVEDALKHIYHHEHRGQTATLESVAGALQISPSSTVDVIERTQHAGLVQFVDGRILLTDRGRLYALQIIRAHRLWERYLADETGVDPLDWHAQAERREHLITPEQADALARRLGDPRFDPHGDPIPTADGKLAGSPTEALAELPEGERARVTHIEDEPHVVYAQLVAEGIYLGMELQVEEKTDQRIVFHADGRRFVLAPMVAANVSIEHIGALANEAPSHTLADLAPRQAGRVLRISPACRGIERRRLMDLGIIPGTRITFERPGMTGGLSAFNVRGTTIALREEQARMIAVDVEPKRVGAAQQA